MFNKRTETDHTQARTLAVNISARMKHKILTGNDLDTNEAFPIY